jgi:hypothetical protein
VIRPKPERPTVVQIQEYRVSHSCGVYTAKDALKAQYDAALLAWLVEAVELLLKERF